MNKVLKKYLKYNLLFCIVNMNDNVTIKNGLTISTGWNLGKNIKSNHLFEPFTSIPKKGTNSKLRNAIKNRINENFAKIFWSRNENVIKIAMAKAI